MATDNSDIRRPGRPANPTNRAAIVAIARGVFATGGYAGASLSQVAERTGLRKASLYHHFSSKEALYLAVLDTLLSDLREMFAEALLGEGDFVERLDLAVNSVLEYLGDNTDAAKLLVREMVDGGPFVEAQGREAIAMTIQVAAQFFELGMAAGQFRQQDAKQLTLSLMGLVLLSYATSGVAAVFMGGDPLKGKGREERHAALRQHVHALCCA